MTVHSYLVDTECLPELLMSSHVVALYLTALYLLGCYLVNCCANLSYEIRMTTCQSLVIGCKFLSVCVVHFIKYWYENFQYYPIQSNISTTELQSQICFRRERNCKEIMFSINPCFTSRVFISSKSLVDTTYELK